MFVTWFERHGGEEEIVGYHLEQAALYRAELGSPDNALAARAGELLGAAGTRAAARGDARAALTLLRRALALLPPQHGSRVELLRELSAALWLGGDVDAAERALSESIEVARATGNTRIEWYGHLERAARNAATHGETGRARRDSGARGRGLREARRRSRARTGMAAARARRVHRAPVRRYSGGMRAGARVRGRKRRRAGGARVADLLCTALLFGPARVDEAIDRVEAIPRIRGAKRRAACARLDVSAGLLAMRAEFERARELYGEAGAVYEELGLRLPRVGCDQIVASVEALAGDSQAAANALRSGYAVLDTGGRTACGRDSRRCCPSSSRLAGAGRSARRAVHARREATAAARRPRTGRRSSRASVLVAGTSDPGGTLAEDATTLRGGADFLDRRAAPLGREAVTAAERDRRANVTPPAAMHLTLARATGDPAEAGSRGQRSRAAVRNEGKSLPERSRQVDGRSNPDQGEWQPWHLTSARPAARNRRVPPGRARALPVAITWPTGNIAIQGALDNFGRAPGLYRADLVLTATVSRCTNPRKRRRVHREVHLAVS